MAIYQECVSAHAKINLFLEVCGKRQDGYHLLSTLMQSVSISDQVTVKCSDSASDDGLEPGICLMTDVEYIPCDARNTAYKAARGFLNALGRQNISVKIQIRKGIPAQAGMGGGSTDAAAVLSALSRIFPDAVGRRELFEVAARIGADVPFCMDGGTQLCEGIGDILTPVKPLSGIPVLFIKPQCSISTPSAFAAFDRSIHSSERDLKQDEAIHDFLFPADGMTQLARVREAAPYLFNDLESVADQENPVLAKIRCFLMEQGAVAARMSGSGSTCFGIFTDDLLRDKAYANSGEYKRSGCFVQTGRTV